VHAHLLHLQSTVSVSPQGGRTSDPLVEQGLLGLLEADQHSPHLLETQEQKDALAEARSLVATVQAEGRFTARTKKDLDRLDKRFSELCPPPP
jgi:hypothetical protein